VQNSSSIPVRQRLIDTIPLRTLHHPPSLSSTFAQEVPERSGEVVDPQQRNDADFRSLFYLDHFCHISEHRE